MGVPMVWAKVTKEFAPVSKGDPAAWAKTTAGVMSPAVAHSGARHWASLRPRRDLTN
jgi:hypothetical protein